MTRRGQNKSAEKALKIAKVAAKLFNAKGYLETNMDDIGNGARLSKGGIYHYFSSKDEILFFVLDNYLEVILQGLEETLQQISDASSKTKFIISRHIHLYTKNAAESKTLLHEAHCLPKKYYKTIAEKERRYYHIVARVLAGLFGSESGVTKAQITVLTFLLFGMCNWIYSWYDPKGTVTAEELSETIFAVFLEGVRKYSGPGSN
jgi:AcrR family transcriptional regulator